MTREEVQTLIGEAACPLWAAPVGLVGNGPGGGGFGPVVSKAFGKIVLAPAGCPADGDFEAFSLGFLDGNPPCDSYPPVGEHWSAPYVDRAAILGLQSQDEFEDYSDGIPLNTLNGGAWNGGAYVDRASDLTVYASDDIESYMDGAPVNSLNGGTGWGGAYVDR